MECCSPWHRKELDTEQLNWILKVVTEQRQQNEMSVLNTIIRKISYTGNIMT